MLSDELKTYCYEKILNLAKLYESTLSSRMEYEEAFFFVVDTLGVPKEKQVEMLSMISNHCQNQGIPYHRLSPVNQFMVATTPYIWYCFENNPPKNYSSEELERTSESIEFTRYVDGTAKKISQQVKGVLWKPGFGCFGKTAIFLALAAIILMGLYLFGNVLF